MIIRKGIPGISTDNMYEGIPLERQWRLARSCEAVSIREKILAHMSHVTKRDTFSYGA